MKEYTNKEKDKDASKANHIGQNTSKGKSNGEKKTNTEVGDKMLKNMLKSKWNLIFRMMFALSSTKDENIKVGDAEMKEYNNKEIVKEESMNDYTHKNIAPEGKCDEEMRTKMKKAKKILAKMLKSKWSLIRKATFFMSSKRLKIPRTRLQK